MDYRFFLIDDDIGVLHMLTKIIVNQGLGDVVGKNTTGLDVIEAVASLRPHIVLVDLLLPKCDGISVVKALKVRFPQLPMIMLSEVQAKDMVARAYDEGIEFFIHKPINVREVVGVIERLDEKLKLRAVVDQFHSAIRSAQALEKGFDPLQRQAPAKGPTPYAKQILGDLGILSESGARDLLAMVANLQEDGQGQRWLTEEWSLTDFFQQISLYYEASKHEVIPSRTIEQRVRRAILSAMVHLANFGLEDFDHELMHRYGRGYFDFGELRKTMRYLEGREKIEGRVNIRKFLLAFLQDTFRD